MKTNKTSLELKTITDVTKDFESFKNLYNANISELNLTLERLLIGSNFDADIKTVTIPANTSVKINHSLKVKPLYRLILKQVDGGVITDLTYTTTYIELKNNGATSCVLTVAILRG